MERFNSEKISAEDVLIADNNAQWLGIPLIHLMECAGYCIADEVIKRYKLSEKSTVVIFCGTGNNGGDGFVVARHLAAFNIKSLVVLVGNPENIRTTASKYNWKVIKNKVNYMVKTVEVRDSTELNKISLLNENREGLGLIIDGLLGTGITGTIREPISTAIDIINRISEETQVKVVSIDLPSGMNPNTGEVLHKAVKADLVIALHRIKKGLDTKSEFIEEIVIRSIGIPYESNLFVGLGDLLPSLKTRLIDNHKGQFGRMLVIGGSKNYSGAPAYSSLTGINFGMDLVITFVPEVVGDVVRTYSPNMIVRTSPGEWLNMNSFTEISELIEWSNVVLIGPGLGQEKKTEELLVSILHMLNQGNKNYILDADALKLIKNHLDLIKGKNVIVTPHEGELKIMINSELPRFDQIEERSKAVLKLAKNMGVTLLVKGPYDYISDGKKLKINRTGCPEMSIGGTGDVLAGLCASFLGTDNDLFESACSAAFLNGLIGEYCKQQIGSRFTAIDMINNINSTLSSLNNR
ncbi:MAG: NAD(P)H-hydrate dehydratase [Promethearchaeota archaeon]|jgi:NAD(P)H-hydrate epimerase